MTNILSDINKFIRNHIDKVAHYGLSMNITLLLTPILTLYAACFITFMLGIAYETTNNMDWKDVLANLTGIAMAVFVTMALKGKF